MLTPVRAPRANAVAERVIGTLRRECLDHVIPLDERHLRAILAEYVDYYNHDRPHRTLRLQTRRSRRPTRAPGRPRAVRSRPVLGGLHHVYECAAEAADVLPSHRPWCGRGAGWGRPAAGAPREYPDRDAAGPDVERAVRRRLGRGYRLVDVR